MGPMHLCLRLTVVVLHLFSAQFAAVFAGSSSVQVSSSQDLRDALLNSNIDEIDVAGDVTLAADWQKLDVNRTVRVQGPPGTVLNFMRSTAQPYMQLGPSGALTFVNLTLRTNTTLQSQPLSSAWGPAPFVNATSGFLNLQQVVLVPGTSFSSLKASLEFWNSTPAAAVAREADTGQLYNSSRPPVSLLVSFLNSSAAGSSNWTGGRVLLSQVYLLPMRPADCYTSGAFAYNSASLYAAMAAPAAVSKVYVYQDILLSPLDFTYQRPLTLTKDLTVYGCPNTTINLNYNWTRQSVVVQNGGVLRMNSGLIVSNAQAIVRAYWPSSNMLLLSLLRIIANGVVELADVIVISPDNVNMNAYMAEFPEAQVTSTGPASLIIQNWTLHQSAWVAAQQRQSQRSIPIWELPSIWASTPVDNSTYWSFVNVSIQWNTSTPCFSEPGFLQADSGVHLRGLLQDRTIHRIQIVNDITFVPSEWPAQSTDVWQGLGMNITHDVEIKACHPTPGSRYTVDFANMTIVMFVFGNVVWSGDLRMINSVASARRNWLYFLIGTMSVEGNGTITNTGVEILGNSPSPFQNAADPLWTLACGDYCSGFIPNTTDFLNVSYYEAFVYNYTFNKTAWVLASRNAYTPGTSGYWYYNDVLLTWVSGGYTRPASPPGAAGDTVSSRIPIAAIVAPVVVGSALLLAVASWLLYRFCMRQRRAEPDGLPLTAITKKAGLAKFTGNPSSHGTFPGVFVSEDLLNNSSPYMHNNSNGVMDPESGGEGKLTTEAQIEELKRTMLVPGAGSRLDQIQLLDLIGEGSYGKVYRGLWKGTQVAIKAMVFPSTMSGQEKREKMAIMETAISSSVSHPNIVQMYTYAIKAVKGEANIMVASSTEGRSSSSHHTSPPDDNSKLSSVGTNVSVQNWEVRLVLEYCDLGSLRICMANGSFQSKPGGPAENLDVILDTALDIACAMVHLHSENIIHSDLKARNILLKTGGSSLRRRFVAKVADFGLSMRIHPDDTHVSNVFQGTMTHMAPEILMEGKISKASDVYSFGILMWELYTMEHAFKGIPHALLGHEVAKLHRRPVFPPSCPACYADLACRCWSEDAYARPSFEQVLAELQAIQLELVGPEESISAPLSASKSSNGGSSRGCNAFSFLDMSQSYNPSQAHPPLLSNTQPERLVLPAPSSPNPGAPLQPIIENGNSGETPLSGEVQL